MPLSKRSPRARYHLILWGGPPLAIVIFAIAAAVLPVAASVILLPAWFLSMLAVVRHASRITCPRCRRAIKINPHGTWSRWHFIIPRRCAFCGEELSAAGNAPGLPKE